MITTFLAWMSGGTARMTQSTELSDLGDVDPNTFRFKHKAGDTEPNTVPTLSNEIPSPSQLS